MKNLLVIVYFFTVPTIIAQSWQQRNNFQGTNLVAAASFINDTSAYICLGSTNNVYSKYMWKYSEVNDSWTVQDSFPGALRRNGISFSLDSFSFIGLGYNHVSRTTYRDIYRYNHNSKTWSLMSLFPDIHGRGSKSVVTNGKAFVVGGGTSGSSVSNKIWQYDALNDSWISKADLPASGRTAGIAFAIDSIIYFGLGHNYLVDFNDIWAYNVNSNTWTQKASLPGVSRMNATAFVVNGKAVVGGGYPLGGSELADFYVYNPISNTWSSAPPFKDSKRSVSTAFTLNNRGYIVGGWDSLRTTRNDVWHFNSQTTALEDHFKEPYALSIYPNPTKGILNIETEFNGQYALYNMGGQLVFEERLIAHETKQLDLTKIKSGFYFYRFLGSNNQIYTGKIIRE